MSKQAWPLLSAPSSLRGVEDDKAISLTLELLFSLPFDAASLSEEDEEMDCFAAEQLAMTSLEELLLDSRSEPRMTLEEKSAE